MTLHVSIAEIGEVVGMAVPQLHRVSTVRAGAVVLAGPKHVSFMYISIYRVSVKALALIACRLRAYLSLNTELFHCTPQLGGVFPKLSRSIS